MWDKCNWRYKNVTEEDIKILFCSIKLSLGYLYSITAVTGICRAKAQFVHSKRWSVAKWRKDHFCNAPRDRLLRWRAIHALRILLILLLRVIVYCNVSSKSR